MKVTQAIILWVRDITVFKWCIINLYLHGNANKFETRSVSTMIVNPCALSYRYISMPLLLNSPAFCVFVQQFVCADIKRSIKTPSYCSFVRGIDRRPVDSPKVPVMQKVFPCHGVVVEMRSKQASTLPHLPIFNVNTDEINISRTPAIFSQRNTYHM